MKEKIMDIQGNKSSPLAIFHFLLLCFWYITQVTGYSVRNCSVSNTNVKCSGRNLTNIPIHIPCTAKQLDISNNMISKITTSDFKDLHELEFLFLSINNISKIDAGSFASLTTLRNLELSKNKLTYLQDHIFQGLSGLKNLELFGNNIITVAANSFHSLTNLETLNLNMNNLHCLANITRNLQQLSNLKSLSINNNNLSTFQSQELSKISMKLTLLDLSRNPTEIFRITKHAFPDLQKLILYQCGSNNTKIQDNSPFFGKLSYLDISDVRIDLKELKVLFDNMNSSLSSLKLNNISSHILEALINISCKIPSLETLNLQKNNLRNIRSKYFVQCTQLRSLDLNNTNSRNLPDDVFRYLPYLGKLKLGHNHLHCVPAAIKYIPTLEGLALGSNKIKQLSCHDFSNLTQLKSLELQENSISALPDCVFKKLTRLQVLNMRNNHISCLKKCFTNSLPNLTKLDLSENTLRAIGNNTFQGLQSLKELSLQNNQIEKLDLGAFAGLNNLIKINLDNNNLNQDQLKAGVFKDLKNLRTLSLMVNHISYQTDMIPDPPFSNLSFLETLRLTSQRHRLKATFPHNLLQGLTNLITLQAKTMQLTSMHPLTFTHTPKLKTLYLSSNYFKTISSELFFPLTKIEALHLSDLRLTSLDFLEQANLTQLQFLQLRRNSISVINELTVRSLPSLSYLDMIENAFTCSCENAWFLQWVISNQQTQVIDAFDFECNSPLHLKGKKLLDFDAHLCAVDISFSCFISTACTVFLFLLVSFTWHLQGRQLVYAYYLFLAFLFDKKKKRAPYQYDAFVSYNIHNEPWVISELLPKLEGEQGWKLCLHHRDFQPGKPIVDNITDAIYKSRKTICVISRHYLESEWCSKEFQIASFRLFDEKKDVLILVFLEDIPARLLSPYHRIRKILKKRTYLSWPRVGEHTYLFWEKICLALKTSEGPAEENYLPLGPEEP